ncbi:MAG: choice-of-anchor D domain-containing protein [Ignavibacteriae bacterium]|nr:choice-of-anchor D domain-containing protein [Ignavibacteriota bacterium]MCB9214688.1 choice-of-anchor D domain-containing protein [Ignavibacteria bacterium]
MVYNFFLRRWLFLFVLFLPITAFAQFGPAPDFPGGPTDGCFSFVIGDVAYIGGGLGSSHMFSFNRTTKEWKDLGVMPGNIQRIWAFAFSYNGKGYIGGGALGGASNVTDQFFEYDPASNTWIPKAPFGGGNRDGCFAFVLGNKAYVGTGFDGANVVADVWEYDFATDNWSSVGNYPGGPRIFPSSFVLNGKGYVVGGAVGSVNESVQLYEFDPTSKEWTQRASYAGTARQAGIAFELNGLAYYGAGMAGYTQTFRDFYTYNATQDRWTKSADQFPDEYTAWTVAFSFGDKAYGGLGAAFINGSLDFSDKLYAYPPDPVSPQVAIDPQNLSLGSVEIGKTKSSSFIIRSVSDAPLQVNSIELDDVATAAGFSLGSIPTLPHTIAPLGSLEVMISFSPQASGAVAGEVIIGTDDPANPEASVSLSGQGTEQVLPGVVLSTSSLNFEDVLLSALKVLSFTISPENSAGLEVQSIEFADPQQASEAGFSMTTVPSIPATLAQGESVEVQVTFLPVAAGDALASIYIALNAPADKTVSLQGKGVDPSSSVEEGSSRNNPLAIQIIGENPVRDLLRFSHHSPASGYLDIQVLDLSGRELQSQSMQVVYGGEEEFALDVSQLPSGTYLLKVGTEGKSSSLLFTKQQ